jgi:RNA polymerase sigma-70 factor, ECF subfamily
MTPAITKPPAALPGDPVRMALDDPEVRDGLLHHAQSTLARRLGNRPAAVRHDAATDAAQETQLRALQKRNDYDPALPVRAWLHGIMNHVLSEIVRTILRLPAQELTDSAAWERLATDFAQQAGEVVPNRLAAADYLAKLPSEHQEIMQLRFSHGMSHGEIATRLGISIGNARVRLCRALSAAKAIAGIALREERP